MTISRDTDNIESPLLRAFLKRHNRLAGLNNPETVSSGSHVYQRYNRRSNIASHAKRACPPQRVGGDDT